MEKLRDHVDKSLSSQVAVLTEKMELLQNEPRVGLSEGSEDGTSASTKAPRDPLRRVDGVAHQLRAEALAQSKAFEAKLQSLEAGHCAEVKRRSKEQERKSIQLNRTVNDLILSNSNKFLKLPNWNSLTELSKFRLNPSN